eukprot:GFYU01006335.1.p1 GENE.GFYU01006335.1~~GFYU01006335.1.p1  ORF type:complete len:195 (+),score=63.19 GFYU01006335.1:33-587(+)
MAGRFLLALIAISALALCFAASVDIEVIEKPDSCPDGAADELDIVQVHYTGSLEDGTVFDSSRAEGREAITVQLGKGQVIQGWEQGIKGMCIGEKRKLVIPPELAYGDEEMGPIPAGSTLTFETELVNMRKHEGFFMGTLVPLLMSTWPFLLFGGIIAYLVNENSKRQEATKRPKKEKSGKKKR